MDRYSRNLLSKDFDSHSQSLLSNAKVLVVGAGGLGSYVLQHLAAAGVGCLGIVEFDEVSLSNLNRQILYSTSVVGKSKASCASERLSDLNPDCKIIVHNLRFTCENGVDIASNYHMVVDCSDNFAARIDIDIVCEKLSIPMIHGSVESLKGTVTVFNYKNDSTYRNLYGFEKSYESTPSGVLSPIVGVVGSLQAAEVIKIITGIGTPLYNNLLNIDLSKGDFLKFSL